MALRTILDAVQARMRTVSGMSPLVYIYEPYAAQMAAMRAFYVDQGLLHAWTITRRSTLETRLATGHENERLHTLVVRGYYALSNQDVTRQTLDPSYLVFEAVVEALCTSFRLIPALGATVETSEPLQVDLIEPRMFCDVLCHYAELRLETQELVRWP